MTRLTLAEATARLAQAIERREQLRIGHQWSTREAGVLITVSSFSDLEGIRRTDIEGPGDRQRRQWIADHLAGHSFATAGDLLAALRHEAEHPGRVPPGALTPAELAGDHLRQNRMRL